MSGFAALGAAPAVHAAPEVRAVSPIAPTQPARAIDSARSTIPTPNAKARTGFDRQPAQHVPSPSSRPPVTNSGDVSHAAQVAAVYAAHRG